MVFSSFFTAVKSHLGVCGGFSDIKRIAEKHAIKNDHLAYEQALTRYDSGISFVGSCMRQEFVGVGKGRYTLNSYRKLEYEGAQLFEKVYALDSLDWRKCQYFHEQVFPRLDAIRVPALLSSKCGLSLAVARFEYVNFSPLGADSYIEQVLSICRQLGLVALGAAAIPREFLDLSQHFGFERCFQKSLRVLERAGVDGSQFISMRARCEALPRFVSHGDLSRPNMGENALVLDWDNFGFYPPGFDLALALVLRGELLEEDDLEPLARELYPALAKRCTFAEFWFSLIFFYGTFLSARKAEHKIYCFRLLQRLF